MYASAAAREQNQGLIDAVKRGDAAALGTLFDRYSSTVFPVALRILRERSEAEELLGDVFWELWNRPERFDASRGNLPAYLVMLARSRAIDRLRSRKKRDALVVPLDRAKAAEVGQSVDGPQASPLESAMLEEQRSEIRKAMDRLTPDQREAVELAFYSDLSHSEISRELRQPLGTVKSRIRNGLIRLRDALRTSYEGQGTV